MKWILLIIFTLMFFAAFMIFFINVPLFHAYPDNGLFFALICIFILGLNYMLIKFLSPINKNTIKICLIILLLAFSSAILATRCWLILIGPAFH